MKKNKKLYIEQLTNETTNGLFQNGLKRNVATTQIPENGHLR